MKSENYLWVALAALAFLSTTSEAGTRRKIKKDKTKANLQSDDPNPIQNQQSFGYDEYNGEVEVDADNNGDYEYYDATNGESVVRSKKN